MVDEKLMMHGRHWSGEDVRGWIVTEKLDGCRGYWDGERMWSRSGRSFPIPDKWRAQLPAMHLEGEIYAGRGEFAKSVAAVVRNQWKGVGFVIFDAPAVAGPWTERIRHAEAAVQTGFAATIPWQFIENVRHLGKIFRQVGRDGGEGLILRCPFSPYIPGRSAKVLKLVRDPLTGFVWPGRAVVEERMKMATASA